jgi:branched-chain amino acid transport system permease protein
MGSLSTRRILLIGLAAVALASFLPLWASGYILGLLTLAYYFGVFAMAWDLLFGFAGEVNFGPTFLIGTGAYTAGILDNLYQPPIWLCLVAGALAAVAGGLVLALPALRVRGPYFGLTTLVAVLMLQNFIVVDAGLTGGEIGLTVPDVISISDTTNYLIALWFMAISGAICSHCRARRWASFCRRADRTRCRPVRLASTSPNTSSRRSSSAPSSRVSPALC